MKKFRFVAIAFFSSSVLIASCSKSESGEAYGAGGESTLYLSIVPQTKASGSSHGVQKDDNYVQTLEIFIFRADGEGAGVLDTYKKFTAGELNSVYDLQINTTTGLKRIYAIANSHVENWDGVSTLSGFEREYSSLKNENLKSFTITGTVEAVLQSSTYLTFSISRLVSRIELKSVRTSFAGTPYENSELQNVKFYLTNVVGEKLYHNGNSPETVTILNSGKAVATDISGCKMDGMLYESIPQSINDSGHPVPHYFYCYSNMLEQESETERYTKLIIQADLNGNTYYYPVPIKGIERNSSYSIDVNIMRPGTLDPEQPLEKGTLDVTLNVLDWELLPKIDVEF